MFAESFIKDKRIARWSPQMTYLKFKLTSMKFFELQHNSAHLALFVTGYHLKAKAIKIIFSSELIRG